MYLFLLISVYIFAGGVFVNGQLQQQQYMMPRQIMPINAQNQFNPFMSGAAANNFQFMQQQQQQPGRFQSGGFQQNGGFQAPNNMQQQQAAFHHPQRTQGILQSPASAAFGGNSFPTNYNFQQQQNPKSSIPFHISFGRNSIEQPTATPYNGGGLIAITEKLMDSNSNSDQQLLPASVGKTKVVEPSPASSALIVQPPQNPSSVSVSIQSLPPFLQGAPKDVIEEFKSILRQPQLPYNEKVKQVESLVSTLDSNRQKLYHEFMNQYEQSQTSSTFSPTLNSEGAPPPLLYRQKQQQQQRQLNRSPSRMPPKQRSSPTLNQDDYFSQITNILQDESIPENERWKQIVGIYGEIEPRVRSEYPFDGIMY